MHACSLQHAYLNEFCLGYHWCAIPHIVLQDVFLQPTMSDLHEGAKGRVSPEVCSPRFSDFFSLVISNISFFWEFSLSFTLKHPYNLSQSIICHFIPIGQIIFRLHLFYRHIDSIYLSFLEIIPQTRLPHNTVNIIVIPKGRILPLQIRVQ